MKSILGQAWEIALQCDRVLLPSVMSRTRKRVPKAPPPSSAAVSAAMRGNKRTNTRPEVAVRSLLHALGYRFRLHASELPGKPDIVFRKRKIAIFVHGC